jgi:hypothetical protein
LQGRRIPHGRNPARRSTYDGDRFDRDMEDAREMTPQQQEVEIFRMKGRLLAMELAQAGQ